MAAAIKKALKFSSKYIKGGGGVFDIVADGKLIFSKKAEGRYPTHEEIIGSLRSATVSGVG